MLSVQSSPMNPTPTTGMNGRKMYILYYKRGDENSQQLLSQLFQLHVPSMQPYVTIHYVPVNKHVPGNFGYRYAILDNGMKFPISSLLQSTPSLVDVNNPEQIYMGNDIIRILAPDYHASMMKETQGNYNAVADTTNIDNGTVQHHVPSLNEPPVQHTQGIVPSTRSQENDLFGNGNDGDDDDDNINGNDENTDLLLSATSS